MTWRIVDPEDPRWAAAHDLCFPGVEQPPHRHARWLKLGAGGEVLAFCSAAMSLRPKVHDLGGPVCYFSRAGVMPDRRGLGLQRSAIRVRERWARSRGAVACVTDTAPHNARSARNLAACGWREYAPAQAWSGRPWRYWIKRFFSRVPDSRA